MENQRIRLTKRLLKDALIDILQGEAFGEVTISEICGRAGINRTTFYKYYADQSALYYDIEADLLRLLSESLGEGRDGESALTGLMYTLRENRKLAAVMLGGNIDEHLPEKIFSLPEIVSQIREKSRRECPRFDELYFFICHGGYELVRRWVNGGFTESPEEMSDLFEYITVRLMG
ncbi:MAG: TetR/AcrR family transcriptional regulator [Clostridia bacterium]|nr:TetR/AcrR family transcriptional regulator [Clostridia bacterium]